MSSTKLQLSLLIIPIIIKSPEIERLIVRSWVHKKPDFRDRDTIAYFQNAKNTLRLMMIFAIARKDPAYGYKNGSVMMMMMIFLSIALDICAASASWEARARAHNKNFKN